MKKGWLAKWLSRDEEIKPGPFGKLDYIFGLLPFFYFFWGLYSYINPTIGFHDSRELITCAWTLGIAHPPGYPLYTLFGKVFITLISIGNIAYRMYVFSCLKYILTSHLCQTPVVSKRLTQR